MTAPLTTAAGVSRIVGMADLKVTDGRNDRLVTYALGSCLGITVHDPVAGVGGMLHVMLPQSSIDADKAKANPAMFVDSGVPLLFRSCYAAAPERSMVVASR